MKSDKLKTAAAVLSICGTGIFAMFKAHTSMKEAAELKQTKELAKEIPELKKQIAYLLNNKEGEV